MWKRLFRGFGILLVTLVSGEIALRYIPSNIQYPLRVQFDNRDGIGVIHPSNIRVTNRSECFGPVTYTTNSRGMHDRERSLEKTPGVTRVAILGDSMMDAEQVNDDQVLNRQLEQRFGGKVEFLNFGMNALGTTQESILYESKVQAFHPDVVMLMFYTENDISNNSYEMEKIAYNGAPFLTYRDDNGVPFNPVSFTAKKAFIQWLNRNFAMFRLARQVISTLQSGRPQTAAGVASLTPEQIRQLIPKRGTAIRNEVYLTPPDALWEQAWSQTQSELVRLKEAVEKNGSQFVVVIVPGITELDPNTPNVFEADPVFRAVEGSRTLDMHEPNRRINQMLTDLNIEHHDLYPAMHDYAEAHQLTFPYFSYSCNSHWTPLGHQVAADALVDYLKQILHLGM